MREYFAVFNEFHKQIGEFASYEAAYKFADMKAHHPNKIYHIVETQTSTKYTRIYEDGIDHKFMLINPNNICAHTATNYRSAQILLNRFPDGTKIIYLCENPDLYARIVLTHKYGRGLFD